MKAQGGIDVELYSFFNLGTRWGGWSAPYPGRFTPRKETSFLFYRRLGGPEGWLGCLADLTAIGIWSADCAARSKTLYRSCYLDPLHVDSVLFPKILYASSNQKHCSQYDDWHLSHRYILRTCIIDDVVNHQNAKFVKVLSVRTTSLLGHFASCFHRYWYWYIIAVWWAHLFLNLFVLVTHIIVCFGNAHYCLFW
jgi:hypothetical protein